MENLCTNIDILLEVMSMLDEEDQLALTRVDENINKHFLDYIWKRKFKLDTNIFVMNENFKAFVEKNCQMLRTLTVTGGLLLFKCHRFEIFANLTEISINEVTLSTEDVYSMARIATNLKIFRLLKVWYLIESSEVISCCKMESLKILHLQYDPKLQLFIENCPSLEELIITEVDEISIRELKHSLLSNDIINFIIAGIRKDNHRVPGATESAGMSFEIIANKDHPIMVSIDFTSLSVYPDCTQAIEHFKLMHLENVKNLEMQFYGEDSTYLQFMKMLSENCKQLNALTFYGSDLLMSGLNINTLLSLRKLDIYVPIYADELFYTLQAPNLYSFDLNCEIFFKENSKQNYQTYANSIEVLTCSSLDECAEDYCEVEKLGMFFELYPNGFRNLKQLKLFEVDLLVPMLKLALQHFRNIKYLAITSSYSEINNEELLEILIKFPLLKGLETNFSFCPDQLDYLRQHIHSVQTSDEMSS